MKRLSPFRTHTLLSRLLQLNITMALALAVSVLVIACSSSDPGVPISQNGTSTPTGLSGTQAAGTGTVTSTAHPTTPTATATKTGKTPTPTAKSTPPKPGKTPTPAPAVGSIPSSWPTTSTTGASGTLANASGEVILSTAGQTYQNMRVNGTISVTACNVTIRNVEVDAGMVVGTDDLFGIWLKQPETCKATLDHVTVQAKAAPQNYLTTGVRDGYGGPVYLTAVKIIGAQIGVLGLGSGTIQDSYILIGPTMRGDHDDGFQIDGSDGVTIKHNTMLNPNGQTSAIALYTEYGPNKNTLVEDNLLAGGGYTCYAGDGKSDNNGNPARAVNVTWVDNVFWRVYFSDAGQYGAGRAYNPAGGGSWSQNYYMSANGDLTTQLVPQPSLDQ